MTLAETIYQHSLRLPEDAAREALDFIEFLEHRHEVVQKRVPASAGIARPKRKAGSAKGVLIIVGDDDAHLADFKEYMP